MMKNKINTHRSSSQNVILYITNMREYVKHHKKLSGYKFSTFQCLRIMLIVLSTQYMTVQRYFHEIYILREVYNIIFLYRCVVLW